MALDVLRRVLPNGLTILTARNRLIPAVSMALGVRAGGSADPAGAEGTAALTARVLDKGTARFDADAIADQLEGCGASLGVGAGRQQIVVNATCLVDDIGAVLPVACDVARHPSFPAHEVATRRAELLTAILEAADDPGSVAVDALNETLYPGGHPLGRPVRGTSASVARLDRDALTAFHRRHFTPGATIAVAVGDLPADDLADRLAAECAGWTGAAADVPTLPTPDARHERALVVRAMPDKAQADVAYGFVGLTRPGAVRPRRPPRRQHPRAAGHGVLRLQRPGCRPRRRADHGARRRFGRERRADDRVH